MKQHMIENIGKNITYWLWDSKLAIPTIYLEWSDRSLMEEHYIAEDDEDIDEQN